MRAAPGLESVILRTLVAAYGTAVSENLLREVAWGNAEPPCWAGTLGSYVRKLRVGGHNISRHKAGGYVAYSVDVAD